MGKKITIKFTKAPGGLTEVINSGGIQSVVKSSAETIAAKASSMVSAGSGFHVEMGTRAFAQDAAHGASRPFARIISNDDETAAAEAEEKILSKAVGK